MWRQRVSSLWLSECSFTICLTPYNRKWNVLSASFRWHTASDCPANSPTATTWYLSARQRQTPYSQNRRRHPLFPWHSCSPAMSPSRTCMGCHGSSFSTTFTPASQPTNKNWFRPPIEKVNVSHVTLSDNWHIVCVRVFVCIEARGGCTRC